MIGCYYEEMETSYYLKLPQMRRKDRIADTNFLLITVGTQLQKSILLCTLKIFLNLHLMT